MAHSSLALAVIAGASYVVYLVLNAVVVARRNAAKARELGCQEPVIERSRWPLGVDLVRGAIKADGEKLFPAWVEARANAMGAYTWKYNILGQQLVATQEPQNIQALLATQFGKFDLGPHRRNLFWPMLGNGIFSQSGADWKHSRDMMRPQFTRDQVSDLDLEERHVQNLMSAVDASFKPDGSRWTAMVDLQDLFFRLTLDSATEFLLGESADSQLQHIAGYSRPRNSSEALHNVDFAWAFDKGQMEIATQARLGQNMMWLYKPSEFLEAVRQCNSFMDHYVRRALNKELREDTKEALDPRSSSTAKDKYVFLDALAEQTQDPIELRSQLMHILLAGRDTTASMLGWIFYSLARDPVRYKKLRDIVVAEFGSYARPRDITFARLKGCQYLQFVNNEALRLYPVVPFNSRYCYTDTKLPVGGGPDGKAPIFIPKGHTVEYSVYLLHRRKDIWGPDADEFRPERWENRKVGWEYVPFNGGPRICLGQQFALTEASYVVVRMLQRFDAIQNMETEEVVRHNLTLTTCSANGVKVALHAAE